MDYISGAAAGEDRKPITAGEYEERVTRGIVQVMQAADAAATKGGKEFEARKRQQVAALRAKLEAIQVDFPRHPVPNGD